MIGIQYLSQLPFLEPIITVFVIVQQFKDIHYYVALM